MKNLTPKGAKLPFGLARQQDPLPDLDGWRITYMYDLFLKRVESEAAELEMVDLEAQKDRATRTGGAKTLVKAALHNGTDTGERRSKATSRAWRRVANWMGRSKSIKKQSHWDDVDRRILEYKHPRANTLRSHEGTDPGLCDVSGMANGDNLHHAIQLYMAKGVV